METTATGPRLVVPDNGRDGFLGSIGVRFMIDGPEAEERFSLVEHPMSPRALAAPHIVQERVRIPYEPYPSLVDGAVQIVDRMLDTAPFVSYGEYMEGYLTRLSTAALLNVTAGGGSTVPTFLVEPR